MSFYGRKLFSSDFERNPAFVRINATVDSVDYTVLLDSPTALERVAPGWERAWTSDDTWVDENGNGERDIDEASASQPVVALWSSAGAEGRVIAVSDPGLFINDMWGREDNAAFVLNMLRAWFPGAHEVMFDETRHKPETVREGAWRTALAVGVLALGNIYGKAMLGLMALLAVGTGIMAVKPPADWRHEDTLGELSFHHLARTSFRSEDRERLRAALLEKARISMCMYPDEFERLSQDELRSIIRDDDLLRLVEEPGRVRLEELEQLTVEVRNWGRG
jgi:hypothetical protein